MCSSATPRPHVTLAGVALFACLMTACGASEPLSLPDAGVSPALDARPTDAAPADALPSDSGAQSLDAGAIDSGAPDSGLVLGSTDVLTQSGVVRGAQEGALQVFRGIPYAEAPQGNLRWTKPQAPAPWPGTLQTTEFGPDCAQLNNRGRVTGAEDCLTLNIWTARAATPRPVMVWIHGGGYVQGASSRAIYEGTQLAELGDVVLVSINYRLGVLGFLATEALAAERDDHAAGNYGTLDQIHALKWVRDNIAAFGGDPDNVTIFGESAGGVSVCTMLGAPQADGLYHRAIIQSGGGCYSLARLNGPGTGPSALDIGIELSTEVGCIDAVDPAACLRSLSFEQLTQAMSQLSGSGLGLPDIGPNVDGVVLPQQPYARVLAQDSPSVPILIGSNADEAATFVGAVPVPDRASFERLVRAAVGAANASGVIALYPPSEYPDPKQAYLDAFSDLSFNCPAQSFARTAASHAPSYVYYFPHVLTGRLGAEGATHGSEIPFVFGTIDVSPAYQPTADDRAVSSAMLSAWASFAHTGVPISTPAWPMYVPSDPQFIQFQAAPSIETDYRLGRCEGLRALNLVP